MSRGRARSRLPRGIFAGSSRRNKKTRFQTSQFLQKTIQNQFIVMKNSTNRILQVVKWTCSFAVILLAVSLCQTAFAQPVLIDTGYNSNNPPTPGPNDIYQTNTLNEVYSSGG